MARIKPKRHGIVTDMTAMCDVAFLLLTFFILTTEFKKPDVEQIKPPSSISETLLPDGNIMTVSVTPEGKFYFQPVNNGEAKMELLERMGKKYNIQFSDQDKVAFTKVDAIGVPMNRLKSFLEMDAVSQKDYKDPVGIPQDSANGQLKDWIEQSMNINNKYKLAVKGDINTKYPNIHNLFEGLRDINKLNFWLITSQENKDQ